MRTEERPTVRVFSTPKPPPAWAKDLRAIELALEDLKGALRANARGLRPCHAEARAHDLIQATDELVATIRKEAGGV